MERKCGTCDLLIYDDQDFVTDSNGVHHHLWVEECGE